MRVRHVLPLLTISALLPQIARATWGTYGNALVAAPYGQVSLATVADGFGGAIVAWQDQRNGPLNGEEIYVQRVNGSGAVLWTQNGVAVCTASGVQRDPQVASDGDGGVIVVWVDDRNSATTGVDLYAQRVSSTGVAQWASNGVPVCTAMSTQESAQILPDGAGGAFIVWADGRNPYGRDIFIQRVNASGIMQWQADGDTLSNASLDQFEPMLVPDEAGGAIAVWRDARNAGQEDIYAQRFNSAGAPLWTSDGMLVRGTALPDIAGAAVSDGAGGVIVVSINSNDIHAQRLNAAGTALWGQNGVALCTHWSGETDPTAVSDGAGGAIVAWKDLRDPNGDIYAQRVSAAGAVLWWLTGEWVAALAYTQESPRAVSDGAGGAIVTWHDRRNPITYDIYAQRLSPDGNVAWPANGVALTTRGSEQKFPVIAPDGAGGAIVAWEDIRDLIEMKYYTDVYARRVSHGGMVLTDVAPSTPSLPLELGDNHPNPFSSGTVFELRLHRDSNVSAGVYDAAGRRVRSIALGQRKAGVWAIGFDGRDDGNRALPSGVYFIRVHAGGEAVTRKMVIAR